MRQSLLFTKTLKTAPSDEVSRNASLLIRAGYVHKEMAGVYSYLTLGIRTLEKIIGIIREEMNGIGGNEILMPALQDKLLWQKTDRWDDAKVDNWFKTEFKSGGETGLGITHEEPVTNMMLGHIASYRDLPKAVYQFQTKFRNELRAKSGIMRGKEFLMKDLYSFDRNEEEHQIFYAKVRAAYIRIFERLGIGALTHVAFASGGIFSRFSEEFQTVSEAGEDIIYVDSEKGIALNKEVLTDDVLAELGVDRSKLIEKKSIEVGNIFHLGTKFSTPLGLTYKDEAGEMQPVVMGSYGIGPTRLLGTIVEVLADEKGLVWPKSIAPFQVHLLSLGADEKAAEIYEQLTKAGIEVLYDDRDMRAGEKFAEADLLGIPYRVVIGKRSIESGEAEVKSRASEEIENVSFEKLKDYFYTAYDQAK
ncbi:MAG: proline--tRNA ligase [Undibacterium sp.]